MIFTPQSIFEARLDISMQMADGTLSAEQGFERAVEVDPDDPLSLTSLAQSRYDAGDFVAAEAYCWRAATANPCAFQVWFTLQRVLLKTGANPALIGGVTELAATKTLRSEEGMERFEEAAKKHPVAQHLPSQELLRASAAEGLLGRASEPEEVKQQLLPHRLIDDLLEADADGLEPEAVDQIVKEGPRCTPLLLGVLRAFANGWIPADDFHVAAECLALLGEIGDPAVLSDLGECALIEGPEASYAAAWAIVRIANRGPEQAAGFLRKMGQGTPAERAMAASLLGRIKDWPERLEILLSTMDDIESVPKHERRFLFGFVAEALANSGTAGGLSLARSLFERYEAQLPRNARKDLTAIEEVYGGAEGRLAEEDPMVTATVYDLCSGEYFEDPAEMDGHDDDDDYDEDPVPQPIVRKPVPGRNDPCWCGSGKKYKKCHLEADEKSAAQEPEELLPPDSRRTFDNALRQRVMAFASDTLGKREMDAATQIFTGNSFPYHRDTRTLAIEFMDWLMHDYVVPRFGRTPTEEFLRCAPGGLSAKERAKLQDWIRSRVSLYVVNDIDPGVSVTCTDQLRGGESTIHDVTSSNDSEPGDFCLARVEESDGERRFTAVLQLVPAQLATPLLEWISAQHEQSGETWDAYLQHNSHKIRQQLLEMIQEIAPDLKPRKVERQR